MEESASVPVPDFKHDELPDARTHIRLLEVLHAPENGQIHCRLTTWALATAPSYTAISYTWGDPADSAEITVNSARMTVRSNCDYVLRQATWYGVLHLWIDAICIQQANDEEKSHQVRIMGDIYRGAKTVLACVGPHIADSDFLCGFLREHRSILSYFANQTPDHYSLYYRSDITIVARMLRIMHSVTWRRRYLLPVHAQVLRALLAMLNRTYFQRIWVAQELYLATAQVMCCGADTCDLAALSGLLAFTTHDDAWLRNDLCSGLRATTYGRRNIWLRRDSSANTRPSELVQIGKKLYTLSRGVISFGRGGNKSPLDLQNLMFETSRLQCTDPRDKIYALQGMIAPCIAQQIRVDYSLTCFELFTRLVPVLLREMGGDVSSAPSWFAEGELYEIDRCIRVQSDDASYLAAIYARRRSPHGSSWNHHIDATHARARLRLTGWVGCRVYREHLKRTADRRTDVSHTQSRSTLVRIVNATGESLAIVSDLIRPGDWVMRLSRAARGDWPSFVLRETLDGSLKVISAAVLGSEMPALGDIAMFTVDFDLEDLSTMYCLYASFFVEERPTLRLPMGQQVEDGVILGSLRSDARIVPSRLSPLETRSEEDFEQYFSVNICYQPDSSWAEKEVARQKRR